MKAFFSRVRTWIGRHRWWILGGAVIVRVLEYFQAGILARRLGDFGAFLDVISVLVLLVALFYVLRWVKRRYLFKVSRRLGLAFLFVGVIPLLCVGLFMLWLALLAVLQMAGHDARVRLEELIAETTQVATQLGEIATIAPTLPDGDEAWEPATDLVPTDENVSVWMWVSETPAEGDDVLAMHIPSEVETGTGEAAPEVPTAPLISGAYPTWLGEEAFSGLVAVGDSLLMVGTHVGARSDGRTVVTLAARPLDEAVADRIGEASGMDVIRIPIAEVRDDDGGIKLQMNAADDDTTATSSETPTDPSEAGDDGDMNIHIGLDEDREGIPGTSLVTIPVVDWDTGGPLTSELADIFGDELTVPVLVVMFSPIDYLKARIAAPGLSGLLWLLTKILGGITLGAILIAVIIGVALTSSVTRAVGALDKGTRRIAAGDLDHAIKVRSKDQLGALANSFNDMTTSVKDLLAAEADRKRLEHEMSIAADVQKTMLPTRFPTIPGLEGAAHCIMARHVGGDLYDFIPIGSDRLGVAVGDVSGKGVSAALVMSNAISSLRSMLAADPDRGPAALLDQLNTFLYESTAPDCFVTMFYAEYNFRTGSLRFANAGHDWPMVVSPDGGLVVDLESSGLMLGALPEIALAEHEVALKPGEVVVAYSDGLVDTVNEQDEPFERERAREVITENLHRSPDDIVAEVEQSLRTWQGEAEEIDDVTIIVLKRVPRPGADEAAEATQAERPMTREAAETV